MHDAAKAWDLKNGKRPTGTTLKWVPKNRPCDWCGKIVPRGYIHKECLKQEQAFWLDILY